MTTEEWFDSGSSMNYDSVCSAAGMDLLPLLHLAPCILTLSAIQMSSLKTAI